MTTCSSTRAPSTARVPASETLGRHLDGNLALQRYIGNPGYALSCVKPVVKTETCQVAHVGYAVSGRIMIKMSDGAQTTIVPGMSYTIPPGHDAWVEGNAPFIAIEVMSAEQYAKPA